MHTSTLTVIATLSLAVGCGLLDRSDANSGGCPEGTEDCPCAAQGCIGELVCFDGVCTDPFGDTDTEIGSGPGTASGSEPGDTSTGSGADESGSSPTPGGPTIVDFGANLSRLTEGDTVIFSATVIDPDGPDDIQGGSLKNADGTITFRPFEDIGNGTFGVTLSWAELHQADPIEFDAAIERAFVADFFDNDGNLHSRSTTLELYCDDDRDTTRACDGACVDLFDDPENCGACGFECGLGDACTAGSCERMWGECIDRDASDVTTCAEYCALDGEACTTGCPPGRAVSLWVAPGCESSPNLSDTTLAACNLPAPEDFESARCCCTVGAMFPG